jgi:hypothetical protein
MLTLGISLFAGSLVALLQTRLGADIPSVLEHRLALNRQVSEAGLSAVHMSLGDERIYNILASARTIDMFYNSAKDTLHRYRPRLRNAVLKGCHIRIVLSDPDSPVWQIPITADTLCPGIEVHKDVNDSLTLIKQIKEEVNQLAFKGSLEVRLHQSVPTGNMLLVNGHDLRYTPYLPYVQSSEVPVYDAVSITGSGIVQRYIDSFKVAWEKSRSVLIIGAPPGTTAKLS